MIRIKVLNHISDYGIQELQNKGCEVGFNVNEPHGILVRSADMHKMAFGQDLLCISRAGAGYNNIPIERCAKEGIVVFNAPGANAEAVKELALCELVLAGRDVIGSIEWVKTLEGEDPDRIAGGMRASVYNAMPMAGVEALLDYMREFEREHT